MKLNDKEYMILMLRLIGKKLEITDKELNDARNIALEEKITLRDKFKKVRNTDLNKKGKEPRKYHPKYNKFLNKAKRLKE